MVASWVLPQHFGKVLYECSLSAGDIVGVLKTYQLWSKKFELVALTGGGDENFGRECLFPGCQHSRPRLLCTAKMLLFGI